MTEKKKNNAYSRKELENMDIDLVREVAAESTDEDAIKAAIDILIENNHYSTRMDKFVTYGAPAWLIGESNVECDTGSVDEMSSMKRALAMHQVGLPVLSKCADNMVRAAAAYAGYEMETMLNDPSPFVRAMLAYRGFGIDQLVKDKSDIVRANVALNGYKLDVLAKDKSPTVRRAVASRRVHLKEFLFDTSAGVREEVANAGHSLNILIGDVDPQVRMCAANVLITTKSERACEYMLKSDDECVRKALASRGFHLHKLASDPSPMVRAAVAQCGFEPEVLAKDSNPVVRAAVISTGYVTDDLIHDPAIDVRVKLATEGFSPNIMCQDESPLVRGTVALYGHETARLMEDVEPMVVKIAMAVRAGNFRRAYSAYNSLQNREIMAAQMQKGVVEDAEQSTETE